MKRIVCLMLMLCFIAAFAVSFTAYTLQSDGTYRSADDFGAYTVDYEGYDADITFYSSNACSISLRLSYPIGAVCAYHKRIVFFCDDSMNNQLIVYVYDIATDYLDSFSIYGAKLYGDTDFCCDDDAIYLEDYRDNTAVTAYSYSGSIVNRYRMNEDVSALFSGYGSGVYAVCDNALYSLADGEADAVSGASATPPLFPADSHTLTSAFGTAYVLSGSRIIDSFPVETDYHAASACVVGNRLYYPCGSTINGYDIDTGERVCFYRLPFDASLLYTDGSSITAVGDSAFVSVHRDDFTELALPSSDSTEPASDSGSSKTPENHENTVVSGISSSLYRVDFERYYITGIAPQTTVAEFKSNMIYDGYSVTIYRGGTKRTSGYVGTAMTAVFTSDSESVTFELSVDGDLTGEGSRNSHDLNTLLDYLIGAVSFDGVYSVSADISGDGTVDIADAAYLKEIIG